MLPLSILPFFQPHFTIFLHLITVVLTSLGRLRLSDEGALEQVASKYSREGCLMSYGQYIEYPTGLMPQLHEFPAHVGQILHLSIVMPPLLTRAAIATWSEKRQKAPRLKLGLAIQNRRLLKQRPFVVPPGPLGTFEHTSTPSSRP